MIPAGTEYETPLKEMVAYLAEKDHIFTFKRPNDVGSLLDLTSAKSLHYEVDSQSKNDVSEIVTDLDHGTLDSDLKVDWHILNRNVKIQNDIHSVPDRPRVIDVFGNKDAWQQFVRDDDDKPKTDYWSLTENKRFSFELKSLKWDGVDDNLTKLSGCCYLLDFINQKRVSESFQFNEVDGHRYRVEIPQSIKLNEIVMVMCLYKPFQGDTSKWLDTIGKGKVIFDHTNENYVQPIAWQAISLNNFETEKSTITDVFYRYDDQKWSDEYFATVIGLRATTVRKMKQLPIKLDIRTSFTETLGNDSIKEIECFVHVKNSFKILEYRHALHFWPLSIDLSKAKSKIKNVVVKIQLCRNDDTHDPNRVIVAINDVNGNLVDAGKTSVCYHSRNPTFLEEFKIELPLHVTPHHHILFTFYHISHKHKREDKIFAYAVLPLLNNGALVESSNVNLPLLKELPDKYMTAAGNGLKYIDKGKLIFEGNVKVSTMFLTQNRNVVNFFNCRQVNDESKLRESLAALRDVDVRSLLKFWPVIMEFLLDIMCSSDRPETNQREAFSCLLFLLSLIHEESLSEHPYLLAFIKQSFKLKERETSIYARVSRLWRIVSQEHGEESKIIAKYSWFLFGLILRDILFLITKNGNLEECSLKRASGIPHEVYDSLQLIVDSSSDDIYRLVKTSLNYGKELNKQLAMCLLKLLSFANPEFIFRYIWKHIQGFEDNVTIHLHAKIEFIRYICNSDYMVPLSVIPIKFLGDIMSAGRVKSLHFFPFLVQYCLISSVRISDPEIRAKMLQMVLVILGKLEADSRYSDFVFKSRLYTAFFPSLVFACELTASIGDRLSREEAGLYGAIFLLLLRYIDTGMIIKWIYSDLESRFSPMIDLLRYLSSTFNYEGKETIEEQIEKKQAHMRSNTDDAKTFIENSYKVGTRNLRSMRSSLKSAYKSRHMSISPGTSGAAVSDDISVKHIRSAEYQYQESFLVILNLNNAFFELSKSPKSGETVFSGVFSIMQSIFENNQNPTTSVLGLKLLGKCVQEHGRLILRTSEYCSELCKILLFFAASGMADARQVAAETIYILLKANAEIYRGNIGKVKSQLTVALSQEYQRSPIAIRNGIVLLNAFAKADASCPKDLVVVVQKMVDNLIAILHEKVKIAQFSDDPELYADMLSKLAEEYQHTPDLRISMLDNLAALHIENGYHAEAGFCKLHCAALAAEYFKLKRVDFGFQFTSKSFGKCSSNITQEKAISTEVDPDEEGICQNPVFSEHGLVDTLTRAIQYFKKAQMFETAIEAMKLIISLHEKTRNIEELTSWYKAIKDTYESISSTTGKRILATYFRVSFKGRKFGDLSGMDFIYKERNVTQLSEIVFRLTVCDLHFIFCMIIFNLLTMVYPSICLGSVQNAVWRCV